MSYQLDYQDCRILFVRVHVHALWLLTVLTLHCGVAHWWAYEVWWWSVFFVLGVFIYIFFSLTWRTLVFLQEFRYKPFIFYNKTFSNFFFFLLFLFQVTSSLAAVTFPGGRCILYHQYSRRTYMYMYMYMNQFYNSRVWKVLLFNLWWPVLGQVERKIHFLLLREYVKSTFSCTI